MMFLFGNKKKKDHLVVADLSNSEIKDFTNFPVGIDENGDFDTDLQAQIEIRPTKGEDMLISPSESCSLDAILNSAKLTQDTELSQVNTLQIGRKLYVLFCGSGALENAKKIDFSKWLIFSTESGMVEDEVAFDRIQSAVALPATAWQYAPKAAPPASSTIKFLKSPKTTQAPQSQLARVKLSARFAGLSST